MGAFFVFVTFLCVYLLQELHLIRYKKHAFVYFSTLSGIIVKKTLRLKAL